VSLIEEALRKQREETETSQSATTQSDTPAPPPVPEENQPSSETTETHRAWPLLAAIAVISVIFVVSLTWLLFFGMRMWRAKPESKASPPVIAQTAAASTNIPTEASVTQSQTTTVAVVTPPLTPEPQTNRPPPPASEVISPAPMAAPPAPEGGEAPPLAKIDTPEPSTTTALLEKVETVIWPRLTVSGIIGTSRTSRGAVIINGQMLSIGATIEGAKVVAVEKQAVHLSFGGETRTLTVGGTTE
jgi:hypothetical protein